MTSYFPDVKHVIMDEVQNFTAEDGDWLSEARELVRTDGRDEDPGYLWLFIDNSQLNHSYVDVPKPSKQVPFFRLKKVIRNSKRIFDYSMQFIDEDKLKIELGHDFCGDEVQREKHSRGESQLICLNRVLTTLFNEGFSKGDVVVLYGQEDCIPNDRSFQKLGLTIVTAEQNNSNYLVVSTFRKYSGLERPVVVTVDLDESLPYGSFPSRSMYCAVTRAMVKLVVIQPE